MSNLEQEAMQDLSGGGDGNQSQQGGGGGGGGGGGASSGIDKTIDQGVDEFASEEGVPGIADSAINKDVNAEVGKFT